MSTTDYGLPTDEQMQLIPSDVVPYSLPYLRDFLDVEANGYVAASTFSGGGGMCLGVKRAGFDVVYASEFVPAARATYAANFGFEPDGRDIRDVPGEAILERVYERTGRSELDYLEGSPPCSSYSTAGKREKGWGEAKHYSDGIHQRTDDLFEQFVRLIDEVRPKVVSAENVPGLALGESRAVLDAILGDLRGLGYRADFAVLESDAYGVATIRERLFIVAVRDDLGVAPPFPDPSRGRRPTIDDVLSVLPDGDPDVEAADIRRFAIGAEYVRLRPGESSERYFSLVRPRGDRPVPTITKTAGSVGAAGVCHPYEPRKFTPRECAVLSSFPIDYELVGTFEQRVERVGRAVPPLLAYAVASSVRDVLDESATPKHGKEDS